MEVRTASGEAGVVDEAVGLEMPSDEEGEGGDDETSLAAESDSSSNGGVAERGLRVQADSMSRVMKCMMRIAAGTMSETQAKNRLKKRGLLLVQNAFWRAPCLPATGVHGILPDEPLHDVDLGDCKDAILFLRHAIHSVSADRHNHRQCERTRLAALAHSLRCIPAFSKGCAASYRRLTRFDLGLYVPGHVRTAAILRHAVQMTALALAGNDSVLPRNSGIGNRVRVAFTALCRYLVEVRRKTPRTEAEVNQYARIAREWHRAKLAAFSTWSPSR
jgi:hypothetical protein